LKQPPSFIFVHWHVPPKRWYMASYTRTLQSWQRCRNLKTHTAATFQPI